MGVHTSIAGGLPLSLERAHALGCMTLQIFSHNPRQWHAPPLAEEAAARFRELRATFDLSPVFVHASYLINLAAAGAEVYEKSLKLLIQELDLADGLGADYVVLHTGSASQDAAPNARKRAVAALKTVAAEGRWAARLLLENTAGERGDISSSMADLAEIFHNVGATLIGGICIDTCHAFAAGYDIAHAEGADLLAREISGAFGPGAVKLVHLNDSKRPLGSRVDRHEHLGQGAIGNEGLRTFVAHRAFKEIPLILETPKKDEEDDRRNLGIARSLLR